MADSPATILRRSLRISDSPQGALRREASSPKSSPYSSRRRAASLEDPLFRQVSFKVKAQKPVRQPPARISSGKDLSSYPAVRTIGGESMEGRFRSQQVEPFLRPEEFGPIRFAPGEALEVLTMREAFEHDGLVITKPVHRGPYRGLEQIVYVLEGGFKHQDSSGNSSVLGPGSVQWLSAGSGIVDDKMPVDEILQDGGPCHWIEIWVNLPASKKSMPAKDREIPATAVPRTTVEVGVSCRVIAGRFKTTSSLVKTAAGVTILDFTVEKGVYFSHDVPRELNTSIYVLSGQGQFGKPGMEGSAGELLVMQCGAGDASDMVGGDQLHVQAFGQEPLRFLLLQGPPMPEPCFLEGPFALNSKVELRQAFVDYQRGELVPRKSNRSSD